MEVIINIPQLISIILLSFGTGILAANIIVIIIESRWKTHFCDSERYVSLTDIQNTPSVTPAERVGQINADVLDKIRDEIVHLHDWAFDREGILRIIDKYKSESEDIKNG